MNFTHRVLTACAAATACSFSAPALAITIVDSINANATPYAGTWSENNVGWYYVPSTSYMLTGIGTKFSSLDDAAHIVTESIYSGAIGNLTLLSSGSFGAGTNFTVPAFNPIALTAGKQYFFAFGNVAGLGSNLSVDPDAKYLSGGLFYDFSPPGTPATFDSGPVGGVAAQPIVEFFGVSAAPEPQAWMMLILGFGIIGVALRRARGHSACNLDHRFNGVASNAQI